MIDSLSVILPVYNEEKDIRIVLNEICLFLGSNFQQYEIIVVNDGSSDGSLDIINHITNSNPNIIVLNHEKNKGYGCAVRTGIGIATMNYIFFMDADGQFRIEDFSLIEPFIFQYDMVIGFRKQRNDTLFRVILGKTFTTIINRFYGLSFRDLNCAFKLMRRVDVRGFELQINGPLINAEILIKAKRGGMKIKEVAVPHYSRLHGQSTGARIDTILKAVRDFVHLFRIL